MIRAILCSGTRKWWKEEGEFFKKPRGVTEKYTIEEIQKPGNTARYKRRCKRERGDWQLHDKYTGTGRKRSMFPDAD